MIAVCRVFSGCIRVGSELLILKGDHQAGQNNCEKIVIGDNDLYILQGKDILKTHILPMGCIGGIRNLEDKITSSTTLSTTHFCTSFSPAQSVASVPILRVIIQPVKLKHNKAFVEGLKKLSQVDPFVEIKILSNGDRMLTASGEVHLERCVNDLENRFIKLEQEFYPSGQPKKKQICKIKISKPIAPFKETLVPKPKTDLMNEDFSKQNIDFAKDYDLTSTLKELNLVSEEFDMNLKSGVVTLNFDLENGQVLKLDLLASYLNFDNFLSNLEGLATDGFQFLANFNNNLLLLENSEQNTKIYQSDKNLRQNLVNCFKVVTKSGPICNEPMSGVVFLVKNLEILVENQEKFLASHTETSEDHAILSGSLVGKFLAILKRQFYQAFQIQPQRLLAGTFTVRIHVSDVTTIASAYDILSSRRANIIDTQMIDDNNTIIIAEMRIIESIGLITDLRNEMANAIAAVELNFTHWSLVDMDPYWIPRTQEEVEHFGASDNTAIQTNIARNYANMIRERKGLKVFGKKAQNFAEKQKTLKKK